MAGVKKKFYRVDWIDAASNSSWRSEEGAAGKRGTIDIVTVGHLVKHTKAEIILALSKDYNGQVADTIAIPKSCVTRIRRLRES
jgi:hypothetical protein